MTTVVPILPHSNQLLLFLKVASCSDNCTAVDLDAVSYCDPLAELYSDTEPGSDDEDNYEEVLDECKVEELYVNLYCCYFTFVFYTAATSQFSASYTPA